MTCAWFCRFGNCSNIIFKCVHLWASFILFTANLMSLNPLSQHCILKTYSWASCLIRCYRLSIFRDSRWTYVTTESVLQAGNVSCSMHSVSSFAARFPPSSLPFPPLSRTLNILCPELFLSSFSGRERERERERERAVNWSFLESSRHWVRLPVFSTHFHTQTAFSDSWCLAVCLSGHR